jgi:biopolymer transport protein ExbD
MRRRNHAKLMAEINITPFTDVVLVLLIIFMITTPLILQSGIKVKLPKTTKVEVESGKSIIITITADGEIFVENSKIDINNLESEISARIMNNPDSVIVINGDKDVKYDYVIKVLDTAKQSGAKKFALGTELKKVK